jgi:hypothetical protein
MGGYHSWPVAINVSEPEGRSIWEHCPFATGTQIFLHVLQLPDVAVRWGDDLNNSDIMGELELGPVPPRSDTWPLQVGCSLNVVPAWEAEEPLSVDADSPAPVDGDTSGVSLHRRNLERVYLWAKSLASTPDEFSAQVWLQDGRGLWSRAPDYGGLPPLITADTWSVDVREAVRIDVQITFDGAPSGPVVVTHGHLTAPEGRQVVRFGGVICPVADQLTDIRPKTEATVNVFENF